MQRTVVLTADGIKSYKVTLAFNYILVLNRMGIVKQSDLTHYLNLCSRVHR
jgi:hypothetical protein